jgi:broad specificity phosphatase PhoE
MKTAPLFVRHGSTDWTDPPSGYQGRTDGSASPISPVSWAGYMEMAG